MATFKRITIGPPFEGIDKTTGRVSRRPGLSSDCLNVEGDGQRIAKRWGITKETATALPGQIYDLAMVAPAVGTGVGLYLGVLYKTSINGIGRANYQLGGTLTDGGIGMGLDSEMMGTLHAAGANVVLVSGPASSGAQAPFSAYLRQGTQAQMQVGFYSGPGALAKTDVMAYHRLCTFAARYNYAEQSSRIFFSDPDAPLLWPPNNRVDAQSLGRYPAITGLHSNAPFGTGDLLYAGGSHNVYAISGATPVTFKMHPTNADFGFSGSRSADCLKGILYGLASRLGNDAENVYDLFAMSGLEGVRIGEPVRSLISSAAAAHTEGRTEAWPWRDAVLFMPRRAGATSTARDVIYFHQPSKTFWRHTLGASISPNCFEADTLQMWIGCADGRVRYFSQTAADDDGTAFSSYWTSGPIIHEDGRKMRLAKLLFWGDQLSDAQTISVEASVDGGSYTDARTVTLPRVPTAPAHPSDVAQVLDYPGDKVGLGYVNRVKLTMPAAGYGVQVTRIDAIYEVGDYI